MKLQLLSDLHLETEAFDPEPAPGAELLVLAGDIDSRWRGYERFAGWPVPVLAIAGNHEFDGRELNTAWPALREHLARFGIRLLQRESIDVEGRDGTRLRLHGAVRWSDFDLLGAAERPRAERAAAYFQRKMAATRDGRAFDPAAVRAEGLACRAWLESALARPAPAGVKTVVVTHFGPSLKSADPRYGPQPTTAAFCNADDDLIERTDLWLHGHLHCRHDYAVARAARRASRVVCNPRGLAAKREPDGFVGTLTIEP
jgi:hypothetical protein